MRFILNKLVSMLIHAQRAKIAIVKTLKVSRASCLVTPGTQHLYSIDPRGAEELLVVSLVLT